MLSVVQIELLTSHIMRMLCKCAVQIANPRFLLPLCKHASQGLLKANQKIKINVKKLLKLFDCLEKDSLLYLCLYGRKKLKSQQLTATVFITGLRKERKNKRIHCWINQYHCWTLRLFARHQIQKQQLSEMTVQVQKR